MLKNQLACELHFVTKEKYSSLLTSNPYLDKVWSFKKDISEIQKNLGFEKFDLLVDLHKNLRSYRLALSLGIKTIRYEKLNVDKFLHIKLGLNRLTGKHIIDRYLESISQLGVKDDGLGMDAFYSSNVDELKKKFDLQKEFCTIVLGANYQTKRVPINLTNVLVANRSQTQFVLIGGKDVEEAGVKISADKDNVVNLCGKLSLDQSTAIIDLSNLVISGDTGMMHIAAALKKPIISIWGSTHPLLGMYPYYGKKEKDLNISLVNEELKCNPCSKIGVEHCPKSHFKCMMDHSEKRLIEVFDRQKSTV